MKPNVGIEPTTYPLDRICCEYPLTGTLPLIRTGRTSPFERDDFTNLSSRAKGNGAGNRVRTGDLLLGKQMYYQLYYTRIKILVKDSQSFGLALAKATQIFQICSFSLA